jgi:hypothetical protein
MMGYPPHLIHPAATLNALLKGWTVGGTAAKWTTGTREGWTIGYSLANGQKSGPLPTFPAGPSAKEHANYLRLRPPGASWD